MTESFEKEIASLSLDELREKCRGLNLKVSGNKAVLQQRLRVASEITIPEEKNEEEDDDSKEEDDDEDGKEDAAKREGAREKQVIMQQPLAFKDVEDSLRIFSVYLAATENRVCGNGWKNSTKPAKYACGQKRRKSSMQRSSCEDPPSYLSHMRTRCRTWKKLEKALISEFDKALNSREVHKELARTKKKNDESYHDYVYKMMEITSHSDIEKEAKIQYIIDGIQNEPINKAILYGAQNIKELRKRLTQYEAMKNSVSQKPKYAAKSTKETLKGLRDQDAKGCSERRCYNCGKKNQLGASCPNKDKGAKCFQCDEFGHLAAKCDRKERPKQVNEYSVLSKQDGKIYKTICIKSKRVQALFDTGSDLHLIKECYIKLGSPPLTGSEIICKGLGANSIFIIGSFKTNVEIDANEFEIIIHVVSDVYLNHDVLLGSDLLRVADVCLHSEGIRISKQKRDLNVSSVQSDVPEIFCIDAYEFVNDDKVQQISCVDASDIKDSEIRNEFKKNSNYLQAAKN